MRLTSRIGKPALLSILSVFMLTVASRSGAQEAGEHLKISLETASDTLSAGATSEILLTFRPRKGFHVNAVPPMGFAVDSGALATLADTIIIHRDTATGYLDTRQKVRQTFSIVESPATGPYKLNGTLTYYYCSDAEGWCRREKTPFSLPIYIR